MTATISFLCAGALTACLFVDAEAKVQSWGFAHAMVSADEILEKHAPPPAGARIQHDIPYGSDPAQRLDLYRLARTERAPILVMVHGGSWQHGDKALPSVVVNKVNHWLIEGFIMVSLNYRLAPRANPLHQADDVARALAYVQQHAPEWGGDPKRIVLMGHSAGAHLVALVAAAPEITRRAGVKPWLGTVALDSTVYNVVTLMERRHLELYDHAFGDDQAPWRAASPTLRLETAPAPMLLVCSSRRADSCAMAREFARQAHTMGGRVTTLEVDMTHREINALLGDRGAYTEAVDQFMHTIGAY